MTPTEFAAAANVSCETMERLEAMDAVLMDWSARHNLIARSTIEERWSRHYLDSAQLLPLLPETKTHIADLGSGAGFPGLVLAAGLAKENVSVTMIESTGKKAAFLSAAIEAMGLKNARVIPERIESVTLPNIPDIVTARALAHLEKLLGYAHGIGGKNTKYFLPKGQDVEDELTATAKSWHMKVIRHPSITNPASTILEISGLERAK